MLLGFLSMIRISKNKQIKNQKDQKLRQTAFNAILRHFLSFDNCSFHIYLKD